MKDKEFANEIHMEIHAVRRLSNYKANPMEIKISRLVIEHFEKDCRECKEMKEKIKNQPEKKDFLTKLMEAS